MKLAWSGARFPPGSLVDWNGDLVPIRYEVSASRDKMYFYCTDPHRLDVKWLRLPDVQGQ
jgi:hypothetical protein